MILAAILETVQVAVVLTLEEASGIVGVVLVVAEVQFLTFILQTYVHIGSNFTYH